MGIVPQVVLKEQLNEQYKHWPDSKIPSIQSVQTPESEQVRQFCGQGAHLESIKTVPSEH